MLTLLSKSIRFVEHRSEPCLQVEVSLAGDRAFFLLPIEGMMRLKAVSSAEGFLGAAFEPCEFIDDRAKLWLKQALKDLCLSFDSFPLVFALNEKFSACPQSELVDLFFQWVIGNSKNHMSFFPQKMLMEVIASDAALSSLDFISLASLISFIDLSASFDSRVMLGLSSACVFLISSKEIEEIDKPLKDKIYAKATDLIKISFQLEPRSFALSSFSKKLFQLISLIYSKKSLRSNLLSYRFKIVLMLR